MATQFLIKMTQVSQFHRALGDLGLTLWEPGAMEFQQPLISEIFAK